jgi:branched-chain amino acid transport system substrate-binding protein
MVPSFSTSCADHSGHAGGWMLQWDGSKFVKSSDLLKPETEMYADLSKTEAAKYAEANKPWPVNEECKM